MRSSTCQFAAASTLALATLFGAEAAFAQVAPAPEPSSGPKTAGFALQASVISAPAEVDKDLIGFNTFQGGLLFGYKTDRVIVGAGFDFTRYSESSTYENGNLQPVSTTSTYYAFLVYPEVQVALARSADRRAELFGVASVGIGTWDTNTTIDDPNNPNTTDPPSSNDTKLRVRWRIAPGVRYWVHSNIGLSLNAGISGDHKIFDETSSSNSVGLLSFYTQLGFVGVF